ncbi:MAG: hypothetical protein ACYTXI_35280 [Nostoc sp.]
MKCKKVNTESIKKTPQIKNNEIPPQHQQKFYKAGWNHERAEAARQRIAITKPWIYSTGAITNLGKKIVARNAVKHGLYSKVLDESNLESVALSVFSEKSNEKNKLIIP